MSTYGDDPLQPARELPEAVSFGPPSAEDPPTGGNLPGEQPAPHRGRRRRAVVLASVAAVVLVGGGAAAWAAAAFLSGDGDQPAAMVPASAVAYASIDLDPSAGQKIAAYRFLRKFPSSDKSSGENDLMGQIVRTVIKSDGASTVDYDRDIKPWLGKRAAVAAVPLTSGADPRTLVVLQVTDEGTAKSSLRKLLDEAKTSAQAEEDRSDSDDFTGTTTGTSVFGFGDADGPDSVPSGLVVRDGYALIGIDQATTQRISDEAARANLAGSSQYNADMERIGEKGVASAWVDLDAAKSSLDSATKSIFGVGGLGDATAGGRVVAVLRFDGSTVELTAKQVGGPPSAPTTGTNGGAILAELPADTTGAIALGHASDVLTRLSTQLDAEAKKSGGGTLADAAADLGITLPRDLQALVGSGVALVVGDVSSDEPQVAVRVVTNDAAGSKAVVQKVRTAIAGQSQGLLEVPEVVSALSIDGIVYAVTPTYAQLVAGTGTLGQQADFTAAVPNAATSTNAAYVSFARVAAQTDDADARKNLDVLRSLGLTTGSAGTEPQMTLRLVAR